MYFDRFDICDAYYVYASDYHDGAGSAAYSLFNTFHRMHYEPSPLLSERTLSDNAREILARLVSGATRIRRRT